MRCIFMGKFCVFAVHFIFRVMVERKVSYIWNWHDVVEKSM